MAEEDRSGQQWPTRLIARRVEKKGLRPRLAAAVIAAAWLIAIVVFGIAEHLIDSDSFETVWDGMWWATQTVTTVGYGDIVPADAAGKVIASILMIGGLSFFAVITGTITSIFVARAQIEARLESGDPVTEKLSKVESELAATRAELNRLSATLERGAPGS
jgi:voltage-gated potassium channel Kch